MMTQPHRPLALLCAAALSTFAAAAWAQTPPPVPTPSTNTNTDATRLADRYSTFAGSDTNADALVAGLRDGTLTTLETTVTVDNPDGTTTTQVVPDSFQPATGKLGYGNVNIALALAQADLNKLGIVDPTGAEITAALNGGDVTLADGSTHTLQGVLALRAQGEGWGQISNTLGTGELGSVVSAAESANAHAALAHAGRVERPADTADTADTADVLHPANPAHPTMPTRPDQPAMPARPERPAMPTRPDLPMMPSRPERPMMPSRPDMPSHVGRPGGG